MLPPTHFINNNKYPSDAFTARLLLGIRRLPSQPFREGTNVIAPSVLTQIISCRKSSS